MESLPGYTIGRCSVNFPGSEKFHLHWFSINRRSRFASLIRHIYITINNEAKHRNTDLTNSDTFQIFNPHICYHVLFSLINTAIDSKQQEQGKALPKTTCAREWRVRWARSRFPFESSWWQLLELNLYFYPLLLGALVVSRQI